VLSKRVRLSVRPRKIRPRSRTSRKLRKAGTSRLTKPWSRTSGVRRVRGWVGDRAVPRREPPPRFRPGSRTPVPDGRSDPRLLEEGWAAEARLPRVLIVPDGDTLVGRQHTVGGIDAHAIKRTDRGITSERPRGSLENAPLGCLQRTPHFFSRATRPWTSRGDVSRLQLDSSPECRPNNRRRSTTSLSSHRQQERAHDE
jgi:hypothetical protein